MISHRHFIVRRFRVLVTLLLMLWASGSRAQDVQSDTIVAVQSDTIVAVQSDSIVAILDSMYTALENDSLAAVVSAPSEKATQSWKADTLKTATTKRNWSTWRPKPLRSMWLALVIPGGGQIYNRKFWKLPIFYGGFIGCIYAMSWNSMMYKDYQQAYLDIMDDDPNTASYNKFLHLGRTIDSSNIERYKQIFKNRKDKYRRWRDLSFFVMVGIYALSVIDAYVDAELSDFDISKDLSMKIRPTLMNSGTSGNLLYATSLGVNCSLNF